MNLTEYLKRAKEIEGKREFVGQFRAISNRDYIENATQVIPTLIKIVELQEKEIAVLRDGVLWAYLEPANTIRAEIEGLFK